jgi:hypothetical protein
MSTAREGTESEPRHPTRRYEGRTKASLSFRIYGTPGLVGTVLAEGDHLMTEEMHAALVAECAHFGPSVEVGSGHDEQTETRAERLEAELREAREAIAGLLDSQFSSNANEIGQAVDRARGVLDG